MKSVTLIVCFVTCASACDNITVHQKYVFENDENKQSTPNTEINYTYACTKDAIAKFISNYNFSKQVVESLNYISDTVTVQKKITNLINNILVTHSSTVNVNAFLTEFNSSGLLEPLGMWEIAKYYKSFIDDYNLIRNKTNFFRILRLSETFKKYCVIIISKNNLTRETVLEVPMNINVTYIHITDVPYDIQGTIITPSGFELNMSDTSQIENFSKGSFCIRQANTSHIQLVVSSAMFPTVGTWRFKLQRPCGFYNVTVLIFSQLSVEASIYTGSQKGVPRKQIEEVMKLGIRNKIDEIRSDNLLDNRLGHLLNNISTKSPDYPRPNYVSQELNDLKFNTKNFYALNTDEQGNELKKLNYVNTDSTGSLFSTQPISIDVGLGSELVTTGGKTCEIFFEVTNFGDYAVDAKFYVSDLQYILLNMQPYRKVLGSGQTTIVKLTIGTKLGTYQDDITFSVSTASGVVQKKVILDVGTSLSRENTQPELDYKYTSDCTSLIFSKCQYGTWAIEIWAKDTGSGLLQITSNPRGIYFPNGFITGTKEQVTGYYSDSCCNPDLQINVVDRLNNRKQWNLNAYWAFWSPGAIAALVFGILLLLILIGVIIYFIVKKIKTKRSYDLPTYRGKI